MYLTVDTKDPRYDPREKKVSHVYLNGQLIGLVCSLDTEEGWLIKYKLDPYNKVIFNPITKDCELETLVGKVTVEFDKE